MAACFYPDGSPASGFPCWNTSSADTYAPCCGTGSYCYSNGWCLASNYMTVFRAGCTDQSWKSNACVQECTGGKGHLHTASFKDLISILAPIGGMYKCDDDGHAACSLDQCGTDKQFLVASGSLLLSGPAATNALQAANYVLNSGSSSVETVSSVTTVTSMTTATSGTDSALSSGNSDSGYSANAVAGVGVGIGLPLFAALLVSLFFLRKERRKAKESPIRAAPIWTGESTTEDFKQEPRYVDAQVRTHHELGNTGSQRAELPQ